MQSRNKQTIDGVPRELLEELRNVCGDPGLAEEVRALLDAPEVLVVPLTGPKEWIDSIRPAAQPQGEPVAWQYRIVEDGKPMFSPLKKYGWIDTVEGVANDMAERPSLGKSRHYEVRKLYAEQPAPVAVNCTDKMYKAFVSVMHDNNNGSEAYIDVVKNAIETAIKAS